MSESKSLGPWVRKAESDWLIIQKISAEEPIPWDGVCFHAQQVAEKLLKALVISRGIAPPRTHDLAALLTLGRPNDESIDELRDDCEFLTRFAAAIRYPGETDEPTPQEGRLATRAAERFRKILLPLLAR